jgi:hypothetical protein
MRLRPPSSPLSLRQVRALKEVGRPWPAPITVIGPNGMPVVQHPPGTPEAAQAAQAQAAQQANLLALANMPGGALAGVQGVLQHLSAQVRACVVCEGVRVC